MIRSRPGFAAANGSPRRMLRITRASRNPAPARQASSRLVLASVSNCSGQDSSSTCHWNGNPQVSNSSHVPSGTPVTAPSAWAWAGSVSATATCPPGWVS